MTGTGWAFLAAAVVLIVALCVVVLDSRSVRQRLRNDEGRITGLELDLAAARDRVDELQSYLSDYDSWAANPSKPVPSHLADRTVRDRWSTRTDATRRPPVTRGGTT